MEKTKMRINSLLRFFGKKFSKDPFPYYFVFCCLVTLCLRQGYVIFSDDNVSKEQYIMRHINDLPKKEKIEALQKIFLGNGFKIKSKNLIENYNAVHNSNQSLQFYPRYFQNLDFIAFTKSKIAISSNGHDVKSIPMNDLQDLSYSNPFPDNDIFKDYFITEDADTVSTVYINNNKDVSFLHDTKIRLEENTDPGLRSDLYVLANDKIIKTLYFPHFDSLLVKIYLNSSQFNKNLPSNTVIFKMKGIENCYSNGKEIIIKQHKNDLYYIYSSSLLDTVYNCIDSNKISPRIFFTTDCINYIYDDSDKNTVIHYYSFVDEKLRSDTLDNFYGNITQIGKTGNVSILSTSNANSFLIVRQNVDNSAKISSVKFDKRISIDNINFFSENYNKVNIFSHLNNVVLNYTFELNGDTLKPIDTVFSSSFLSKFGHNEIFTPKFSETPQFYISLYSGLTYIFCKKSNIGENDFDFISDINWDYNSLNISTEVDYFYILFLITILLTFYGVGFIYIRIKYPKHILKYEYGNKKTHALKNKMLELENISDNLYIRSNVMLFVGLVLGIGGMIVSIFMFDSTYENIKSLSDAATIVKIVRNTMFLFFVEMFAFFFFKQYRINYNEFKMFKGVHMRLMNYIQILELSSDEYTTNKKLIEMFANEKIDFFESNNSKIDEFNDEIMKKAMDIIGQHAKK